APLLAGLVERTREGEHWLLHGNALELAAQSAFDEARFDEARRLVGEAETVLGAHGGLDAFYVEKWKAMLDYVVAPRRRGHGGPLDAVRRKARELHHWETIRDCDRLQALHT